MESKLLASALMRFDEQPLRFVEQENHGTPWHELASSDVIKTAINTIPGFTDKIIDFARSAVGTVVSPKGTVAEATKAPSGIPANDAKAAS